MYIYPNTWKSPDGKLKTGIILVMSAIYLPLLTEIKLHMNKHLKQKGQAEISGFL